MRALELYSCVSSIVPAVVQNDAGTLAQSVGMLCGEPQLQNSHDHRRRNWCANRAVVYIIELFPFDVAKTRACQTQAVAKGRPR